MYCSTVPRLHRIKKTTIKQSCFNSNPLWDQQSPILTLDQMHAHTGQRSGTQVRWVVESSQMKADLTLMPSLKYLHFFILPRFLFKSATIFSIYLFLINYSMFV